MSADIAIATTSKATAPLAATTGGARSMVATPISAALTRTPLLTQAALAQSFVQRENLAWAGWAQRHREGCATLLALAVSQKWLCPLTVSQALQAGQEVALGAHVRDSLDQLITYLNKTARAVLVADWPQPDWFPWLSLELIDQQPLQLVLQAECFWEFRLNLNALPPALGVAIAHTLDLINGLTEVDRLRDMADGWFCDNDVIYQRLVQAGVTNDVKAAWAYVQDNPVNEFFDWNDAEHFSKWLKDAATFAEPTAPWMQRYQTQWKRWLRAPRKQRLMWLAQKRRRWQQQVQWATWTTNPWRQWFDHARRWLRHADRQGLPRPCTRDDANLYEATDWEPLGYTQYIGFEEAWEDGFSAEWQEYLSQSGNYCGLHLHLRLDKWQAILPQLQAIAIGQGLLLSAWQANEANRQSKVKRNDN